MLNQVFKVAVPLFPDETITVFFTREMLIDALDGRLQFITTCGVRLNNEVRTHWGNTISNPNDIISKEKGRQWAFRRAFLQMAQYRWGIPIKDDRIDFTHAKSSGKSKAASQVQSMLDGLRKALRDAGAWE